MDDCDLESILNDAFDSWSLPPVNLKPLAGQPESITPERGRCVPTAGLLQPGATVGLLQPGATTGSSQLGATAEILRLGAATGFSQLGTTAGVLQPGAAAGSSQLGTTAGILQPNAATGSSQLGTTAGLPQLGAATGSSQLGTTAELLQPGAATGSWQLGATAGLLQPGATTRPPQQLQNPSDIVNLPEFFVVNEANVGKFARTLASRSVFGDNVLRRSTFKGDSKRGLEMLDKTKLTHLFTVIHNHPSFANYTRMEFNDVVKKKIMPSLQHLCKELLR